MTLSEEVMTELIWNIPEGNIQHNGNDILLGGVRFKKVEGGYG